MLIQTPFRADLQEYPRFRDGIPGRELREGRYLVRFATCREELDRALRLRFEVFNLELGEGLESSYGTGRDLDEYDAACHHLLVIEAASGEIVGTYRLQTGAMAAAGRGFYSAAEFDLSGLPVEMLEDSIELGRACIAREHRNTQALFLLWKGLAMYIAHNRKRFLFGCCSLTSQDPGEGWRVMELLEREGHVHPAYLVPPREEFVCDRASSAGFDVAGGFDVKLPRLFRTYIRFGARVCGPPAIDRAFKTIDYFVLFDVFAMDSQSQHIFFSD
ncbi:MAG: GNAT family N-acyltransferase [Blastocatellia bacterium]|nr:GNAT family N-acyltransferase [Blastocatellia bacterium]